MGAPSCDVHEVDVEAVMKEGEDAKEGGPPVESLPSCVAAVLSRQGAVDILVNCPAGEVPMWYTQACCP